jgi:hypothetical protein
VISDLGVKNLQVDEVGSSSQERALQMLFNNETVPEVETQQCTLRVSGEHRLPLMEAEGLQ